MSTSTRPAAAAKLALAAALALLAPRPSAAETPLAPLAAPKAAASAPLVVVPLDKQYVPVVRNGATVSHKTAYFGQVFVGLPRPQPFTVLFDTGSGHLILPSAACESETCTKHRRYNRTLSGSAVDINHDGTAAASEDDERDEVSVVYGTGEILGQFVRETVCLYGARENNSARDCSTVRVVLAREMTEEPFGAFRFDGVVGLSLDALSLDPEFNFFGQFAKSAGFPEARFGYFLSRSDQVPSEIAFGGHDPRRAASPMQWVPVHRPASGYWQVAIHSIHIGGKLLKDCQEGACTAIVDTGTSLLGVPRPVLRDVHLQLARKVDGDPERLDCRETAGPELVLELAAGVRITLGPKDYARAAAMRVVQNRTNRTQVVCRASLMAVDPDPELGSQTWILGEPVLRKYYTAYDWRQPAVGFALARQAEEDDERTKDGSEALAPSAVHI